MDRWGQGTGLLAARRDSLITVWNPSWNDAGDTPRQGGGAGDKEVIAFLARADWGREVSSGGTDDARLKHRDSSFRIRNPRMHAASHQ